MAIENIQNNESGLSVRTKLNKVIGGVNDEVLKEKFISYTVGDFPDSTNAVENETVGAYFPTKDSFQKLIWDGTSWINLGEEISTVKFVNDKASLLASQIEAASQGIKPFATKADMDAFTPGDGGDNREIAQVMNDPTLGNNGIYRYDTGTSAWIKRDSLAEVKDVKGWVLNILATDVGLSNRVYNENDNLESADILWPDGLEGTVSDLVEDSEGRTTSLRYNRPDNKYITLVIEYDNGDATGTLEATGY